MRTLERVNLVSLDVSIWSGRKKLSPEDILIGAGGRLPPDAVASLGSKKVCDPDSLKEFTRVKRAMETELGSIGVSLLGGFAIPLEATDTVCAQLDKLVVEFGEARVRFGQQYDQGVEEWVGKFPDFATALRRATLPVGEVLKKLSASYSVFRIQPSTEKGALGRQVETMGDRLLDEVAADAKRLYDQALAGKTEEKVNRRIGSPLLRIRQKLNGLSFLDGCLLGVVNAIDDLVARFPDKGYLEGSLYKDIVVMVLQLSSPDAIRSLGAANPAPAGLGGLFATVSSPDASARADAEDAFFRSEEEAAVAEGIVPAEAVAIDQTQVSSEFAAFSGLFGTQPAPAETPVATSTSPFDGLFEGGIAGPAASLPSTATAGDPAKQAADPAHSSAPHLPMPPAKEPISFAISRQETPAEFGSTSIAAPREQRRRQGTFFF